MKLFLDDLRPIPDPSWVLVKTADQAIDALLTGNVVELSLDHDLGPPEAGTGYDVAVFLEEQAFLGNWAIIPSKITIHSANPVGRANMEKALRKCQRS